MRDDDHFQQGESIPAMVPPDPFTWAWVGTKIAEGALQWVGGRLLATLFDSFAAANLRIAEQLRTELREEALRRAVTLLDSLTVRLGQYHNAGGIDRLELANKDAEDLVAELRNLGPIAFRSYHSAVGLSILVLQDRFKAGGNAGEKRNIREAIDRAEATVLAMHPRLLALAEGRVGDIWFMPDLLFPPPMHGVPGMRRYLAGHHLDGNRVETVSGFYDTMMLSQLTDQAKSNRSAAIAALREDVGRNQIAPSMAILQQWRNLRARL
jgi:hypothetical protein